MRIFLLATATFTNTTTTGTKLAGDVALGTSIPQLWPFSEHGVLDDTIAGEGVRVAVSPNSAVDGFVEYVEVA